MSLSPALTTGSGTRTGAGTGTGAGLGGGSAATRLKFGEEKRLKSGTETRSKRAREKRGKKWAPAAPMAIRAASDTAITGTRLEATCGAASGCLSPCVSLSAASVTCVPHALAQSRDSSHRQSAQQTSHRGDKPASARARLPTGIRVKSWARMVNVGF